MKRTPKNYDGVAPPAKTIGDLLPELLGRLQRAEPAKDILKGWPDVVGAQAKWTQAVSFVDGILTVIVKNAALYNLLCQYEKPRLLRLLQEQFPKNQVRNIVFRIG